MFFSCVFIDCTEAVLHVWIDASFLFNLLNKNFVCFLIEGLILLGFSLELWSCVCAMFVKVTSSEVAFRGRYRLNSIALCFIVQLCCREQLSLI